MGYDRFAVFIMPDSSRVSGIASVFGPLVRPSRFLV